MNGALADAYRGRRVLVTGHTGFKGSWLVRWLVELGAEVHGLAVPGGEPTLFALAGLDRDVESHTVDVRDASQVRRTMQRLRPELVLHLAAQSLVRASYADPVGTYAINVMGTVHVLDAIREVDSVRGALIVTSDKCYENMSWPWAYRESDAMGGHDPYSSSKGCAELVTSAFRRSFFQRDGAALVASARAGNVIGGGDWATDRLVPDLVRGAVEGRPTPVRNPRATRPWQHVLDALGGYLQLGQRLLGGQEQHATAWNFGPSDRDVASVERVVAKAGSRWEAIRAEYPPERADDPHEAATLRIDSGRARAALSWSPVFTFDEAVDETIAWYRDFHEKRANARELLECQITAYRRRFE